MRAEDFTSYARERHDTLVKQVNADQRKLQKFGRTGEPPWLSDPNAMLRHRLNCYLRRAERDWLRDYLKELGD